MTKHAEPMSPIMEFIPNEHGASVFGLKKVQGTAAAPILIEAMGGYENYRRNTPVQADMPGGAVKISLPQTPDAERPKDRNYLKVGILCLVRQPG